MTAQQSREPKTIDENIEPPLFRGGFRMLITPDPLRQRLDRHHLYFLAPGVPNTKMTDDR